MMTQVNATEWEHSADVEAESSKMNPNALDGTPATDEMGHYQFTVLLMFVEGMRHNEEIGPRGWIHQMHVTSEQNSVSHAIQLAQYAVMQERGWVEKYTPAEVEVLRQGQLPIAVFSGHLSDQMGPTPDASAS